MGSGAARSCPRAGRGDRARKGWASQLGLPQPPPPPMLPTSSPSEDCWLCWGGPTGDGAQGAAGGSRARVPALGLSCPEPLVPGRPLPCGRDSEGLACSECPRLLSGPATSASSLSEGSAHWALWSPQAGLSSFPASAVSRVRQEMAVGEVGPEEALAVGWGWGCWDWPRWQAGLLGPGTWGL